MEGGMDISPRAEIIEGEAMGALRGAYEKLSVLEKEKEWVGVSEDWGKECERFFRGLNEERIVVRDGAVYFDPAHLNLVERPSVIGGGLGKNARHDDYWFLGKRIDDKPEAISVVAEQLGVDLGGGSAGDLRQRIFGWGREKKTDGFPKRAIVSEAGGIIIPSEKVSGLSLRLDTTGGVLNMDVHFSLELVEQLSDELNGEKGKTVVREFSRGGK